MERLGPLRYYPLIDSVLFDGSHDDDLPTRIVGATSALLLDLVVHQTVPVLSQSQVIDSAFVLDAVRDESTHDAFLGLVADSLIQARFLSVEPEGSPGENPFTVLNAFASRLRSEFHFSAWPELADRSARETVLAVVTGTSREPLDGELGERLEALRALDKAFRHSAATEKAEPVVVQERLGPRVLAELGARSAGEPLRELGDAVEAMARAAGENDRARPVVDLDSRSAWRRALPEAAARLGYGEDIVAAASDLVDMHYNCVVALSLGAASCSDETVMPRIPIGLRDSVVPIAFDERATFLLRQDAPGAALTWNAARERLMKRRFVSADVRLEELLTDRLIEIVDGRRLVKVAAAAPRRLLSAAHGGAPGGLAGYLAGGHLGLLGAVLGGVLGEALTPDQFLLGGKAAGRWEEMVRRRAVGGLRRSIGMTVSAGRS